MYVTAKTTNGRNVMKRYARSLRVLCLGLLLSGTVAAVDAPKLDGSSDAPVLLRYKFEAGQEFPFDMVMNMTMSMNMGSMKMEMPMEMTSEGRCTVKGVTPEGNFQMEMIMTRVTMSMDMMGNKMAFDSKETPAPTEPQFKPLAAMIGKVVTAVISPRGETIEVKADALVDAMKEVDANSGDQMKQQFSQVMNSSFIQLPENPVKIGDAFDSGAISQDIPGVGTMEMVIHYKVSGVSGDGAKVMLEPTVDVKIVPAPEAQGKMDVKVDSASGWLLFDIAKGNIGQSNMLMNMNMTMEQMNQKMDMLMKMDVLYSVK